MDLERIDRLSKGLIAPLITQIFFPKKQIPTILDCQLRDLEEQIKQGRGLLNSGKSQIPEQLEAQLNVLDKQRAKLLT